MKARNLSIAWCAVNILVNEELNNLCVPFGGSQMQGSPQVTICASEVEAARNT